MSEKRQIDLEKWRMAAQWLSSPDQVKGGVTFYAQDFLDMIAEIEELREFKKKHAEATPR